MKRWPAASSTDVDATRSWTPVLCRGLRPFAFPAPMRDLARIGGHQSANAARNKGANTCAEIKGKLDLRGSAWAFDATDISGRTGCPFEHPVRHHLGLLPHEARAGGDRAFRQSIGPTRHLDACPRQPQRMTPFARTGGDPLVGAWPQRRHQCRPGDAKLLMNSYQLGPRSSADRNLLRQARARGLEPLPAHRRRAEHARAHQGQRSPRSHPVADSDPAGPRARLHRPPAVSDLPKLDL